MPLPCSTCSTFRSESISATCRLAISERRILGVDEHSVRFRYQKPHSHRVRTMTLPIMVPGLLIGVSLLVLMTNVFHLQLSIWTAVIGQAVYTTPFVLLLVAGAVSLISVIGAGKQR